MSKKDEKKEYSMQWCKYEFDQDEMNKIAGVLAIKTQELESIEDEKKAVMNTYKDRSAKIALEIKNAANQYKDGYEMRDIECIVERDFETGNVTYVRLDNGEIARTVTMTMQERQMKIDEVVSPKGAKTEEELKSRKKTEKIMQSEQSSF